MKRPARASSFGRRRCDRNLNQFSSVGTRLGQPRGLLWPRMWIFVNLLNRNGFLNGFVETGMMMWSWRQRSLAKRM